MKIEVIIPVVQFDLAVKLLSQIESNTLLPCKVIIVDNTDTKPSVPWLHTTKFLTEKYYSTTGRMNESWEIARKKLSSDCDYVSFLNDDIVIGDWFFQRVIDTFTENEKFGIACPNTVDSIDKVISGKVEYVVGTRRKLEAWAFTIRRELLDQIPPVPWDRITTFHGDTWVWRHVEKMGYVWGKDLGNNIYHYVGQSVLKFGFRRLKRPERNEWNKIKQEIK